jgi:hypothetical protein
VPRHRSVKLATCVEAASIAEVTGDGDEGGGSIGAVAECGVASRCSAVVVYALTVARNADVRRCMVSARETRRMPGHLKGRGVFPVATPMTLRYTQAGLNERTAPRCSHQ